MLKKILIVDDDKIVRNMLALFLERFHCDFDTAFNAEEALGLIGQKRYDAVFTDYQMPGMNGIELIRNIRAKSPHSAVILMTGCADEEMIRHSGADACLMKPFSADAFKESLDRVLHEDRRGSHASHTDGG